MNFTSFSPNVLSLLQNPTQDPIWHLLVMSPWPYSICDSSLIFPYVSWPWHFRWVLVSYFVECLSIWVYWMLYHDLIEVMHCFGKKTTKLMCIVSESTWCWWILSLLMLTVIAWLRWCLLGFLTVKWSVSFLCKLIIYSSIIIPYNMPLIVRAIPITKLSKCKHLFILEMMGNALL